MTKLYMLLLLFSLPVFLLVSIKVLFFPMIFSISNYSFIILSCEFLFLITNWFVIQIFVAFIYVRLLGR